jgi:glycosyltransferase involved in cell wall biosynthesis
MPSRDLRLLIAGDHTGDVFHSGYAALRSHLDRHQTTEVCFTGPVPDRTLAGLMRLAQALVLPSLDEGFGLPGIEAAACGAAVVATRHSALPEVLGDAAVYFDPYEPGGLRRAIEPVLQDAALRAALGARASERAGRLSWTAAARSLLAAFDELAS